MLNFLRRVFICVVVFFACWLGGLIWFVAQIPAKPAADTVITDAIVVLTGGSGRIPYGLRLLTQGKASRLFISGVESQLSPDQLVAMHQPQLLDRLAQENRAVVMLGYDARNTIGNAAETARWMHQERLTSLRLVTTDYHMPRALKEFHFAMPNVTMIPDPVLPENSPAADFLHRLFSPLILGEYHKYLAAGLRHWLIRYAEEE